MKGASAESAPMPGAWCVGMTTSIAGSAWEGTMRVRGERASSALILAPGAPRTYVSNARTGSWSWMGSASPACTTAQPATLATYPNAWGATKASTSRMGGACPAAATAPAATSSAASSATRASRGRSQAHASPSACSPAAPAATSTPKPACSSWEATGTARRRS